MPTEEQTSQDSLQLGQEVFDGDGNRLGKIQARFERYVLVERGGLFGRAYYVPRAVIGQSGDGALSLDMSEAEMRKRGFHQVPDEHGERAIAVSRPFAGHARRRDPGESPPYTGWQAPYARYGERVSVGSPCWLDRPACTLPR